MNKKQFKNHCHNIRTNENRLREKIKGLPCGAGDGVVEKFDISLKEFIEDKPVLKYWMENRNEESNLEWREREVNYLKDDNYHIEFKDYYFKRLKNFISSSLNRV